MLFAMFVLAIALGIGLSVSALIINQVKMAVDAGQSVAAFYAADAGAEKCLYQVRKPPSTDPCDTFPGGSINTTLTNGASFIVSRDAEKIIRSLGTYQRTNRKIELSWQ